MDWISIDTEPMDGQLCAIFDPTNEELQVWPAQYCKQKKCFFAGSRGLVGWFEYDDVTHWIPMPAPPTI